MAKSVRIVLVSCVLWLGVFSAAGHAQVDYNKIGIYTTQDADPAYTSYHGAPGQITAYVVISNPRNFNLGGPGSGVEGDISVIGGFEFKIVIPPNVFLLSVTLPPQSTNFSTPPNFLCGTRLPVVDFHATAVTLTLGEFSGAPGFIYLAPHDPAGSGVPSIPGSMALTDYNDDFRLNPAYPASGSFDAPVFGLWEDVTIPGFEPDWWVRISLPGDDENILGVGPEATDGFDADLDEEDTNLGVTFHRPGWEGTFSEYFAADFREPYDLSARSKSWDFTVNLPAELIGQYVSLTLTASFGTAVLPDIVLTDFGNGTTTELGPVLTYSFFADSPTRGFSLRIGNATAMADEVRVEVQAAANGLASNRIVAGVHEAATDAFDGAYDVPQPAPPPGNFVAASFEHAGWPLGPRFSADIRAPFDPLAVGKTWPLLVETDQAGLVNITFAPNFGEQVPLILHDLQTDEYSSLFPDLVRTVTTSGPAVLRYELIVGGELAPPLAPASRAVTAGWSLVAPPLVPAPGAGSIDAVVLDQAPGYSYVFGYQPGSGYSMVPGSTTTAVGRGYWLATDTGFTWTMEGTRSYSSVRIALASGWNLCGYPLWFPGPADGIRVSSAGVTMTWADAQDAGWISGLVGYDQVQDDYVGVTELQPWHAYWVAGLRTDLAVTFSWLNFLTPGSAAAKSALEIPVSASHWRTVVTLDDGSGRIRSAEFGADARATDGFDAAWDLPRPPAGPSGGASLAIARPDWELPSGDLLATDITAPLDGRTLEWRLRITPARPGQVTLDWSNRRWPDGQDLQLYLPSQNRVIVASMRERSSVRIEVGAQPLDVIVRTPGGISGVADQVPFAGYSLRTHPNPFNPQTTITFALPRDGRAEVRIYSVRGELVDVLGGRVLAAGPRQFTWRGTDRAGRAVPSGSYFARLLVDGEHVGQTAKMSLIR